MHGRHRSVVQDHIAGGRSADGQLVFIIDHVMRVVAGIQTTEVQSEFGVKEARIGVMSRHHD